MNRLIKFCPNCDALFTYTKSDDDNSLVLLCRSCGHTQETDKHDQKKGILSVKMVRDFSSSVQKFALPTKSTSYDTTLYHTTHMKCPNDACKSKVFSEWKEDGTNIPCVKTLNRPHQNRLMYFVCGVCHQQWYVPEKLSDTLVPASGAGADGFTITETRIDAGASETKADT